MSIVGQLKKALDRVLAPAEPPAEPSLPFYDRQVQLLERVRAALAALTASRTRLEAETARLRGQLPHLLAAARTALIAGDEEQARASLRRRYAAEREVDRLADQIARVKQDERLLRTAEERLATHLETFRSRLEVLSAQHTAAEAQVRIKEAMTGLSTELDELGQAVARAEESTEAMQLRAAAIDELVQMGVLRTPDQAGWGAAEHERADEDEQQAVERELEALRAATTAPAASGQNLR